jgi:hypothetical protein
MLTSGAARAADLTLDLTGQPLAGDILPEISFPPVVGGEHQQPKPKPKPVVPLDITIQDMWPRSLAIPQDRMDLSLLIRNTGTAPVMIPASKSYTEVMRPGNQNRTVMGIFLEFSILGNVGGGRRPFLESLGVSAGSTSVPGSMMELQPQQSVVIRAGAKTGEIGQWIALGPGVYSAGVRAVLGQDFVRDDRLEVAAHVDSPSTNSVDVTAVWKP